MGGIYRPKGCSNWTIYYSRKGKRVREATGSSNYRAAQQLLKRRVGEIAKGEFVGPEVSAPLPFNVRLHQPIEITRSSQLCATCLIRR